MKCDFCNSKMIDEKDKCPFCEVFIGDDHCFFCAGTGEVITRKCTNEECDLNTDEDPGEDE